MNHSQININSNTQIKLSQLIADTTELEKVKLIRS